MLPPEYQPLVDWIVMPIVGFGYDQPWLYVLLFGIEIPLLIFAIRGLLHEIRDPTRIWWKLLIKTLLAIVMIMIVVLSVIMFVWVFLV